MKGNNTLELCEAALIEIVQEGIEKRIPDNPPIVDTIECRSINYGKTFVITLIERTEETE